MAQTRWFRYALFRLLSSSECTMLVTAITSQAGAEASCGIYSIVTTARANGLMPICYLEWLLNARPNTSGIADASALDCLMPWSPDVPESCRMTPAEAAEPDPLVDVDSKALDEE